MRWIGLATMMALAGACSQADDIATATAAVDSFHRQFNAGDYDAIYANADRLRKSKGSAEVSAGWFKSLRGNIGDFRSGERSGWNEQITMNGRFVTLTFRSRYTGQQVDESFIFRIDGSRALMMDYKVTASAN